LESGGDAAKAKAVLGHRISVDPAVFASIVNSMESPLVVFSKPGSLGFSPTWSYLTSYKGFLFHTVSKVKLSYPHAEMIETKKIV
jgi:hypothetical protein